MNALQSYIPLLVMIVGAFIPFGLVGYAVRIGRNGLALTILALVSAVFAILVYAANGTFGIDPLLAMSWAMIFAFPALLGALAGALLGWLMRRRDDRNAQN